MNKVYSPRESFIVAMLAIVALWFFSACQGPAGPDGTDSHISDSLPPQIEWMSPAPGSEIDSLVLLQVRAVDNSGVYRVVFYIAGFEFAAELTDSTSGIYSLNWNAANYPEGPYPLMSRAWDESRQTGTTPVRVIYVVH